MIISHQPNFEPTKEEEIGALQKSILEQLSQDPALRGSILNDDTSLINDVIRQIIPGSFNFTTRICSLGNVCPTGFLLDKEVYVDEYIIAANLTEYDPKIVRLYWWEGSYPDYYPQDLCGNGVCENTSEYRYAENSNNCAIDCGQACSNECTSSETTYYKCSSNQRQILKRTCGNYNTDSCLEYDGDWQTHQNCLDLGNYMCKKVGSALTCAKAWARVGLRFSGTRYESQGIYHYYYHTRTFTETNGVGVTFSQGQICYLDGTCDPKGAVNYRIEPNGQLVLNNLKFYTSLVPNKFTLKYWGIDDNGYAVYIENSMCISATSFEENC